MNSKQKVAKVKCNNSLLFFTRYFFKHRFNKQFIVNRHHEIITEKLQDVVNGKIKRLIINMPPRYGKTELAVINFIAYSLAINPASKFIHLSYSDDLALNNSEQIKDLVLSDEYQELYGLEIKKDSKGKKKWYNNKGGGVYATSTGGQITGFGAGALDSDVFEGAIIIDDYIKPEDADSDTIREKLNARYTSTIRNRTNSEDTPIIVIMQRLHPKDLTGYLIDDDLDKWEVLSLPSINEDGTPLWEFKHTLDDLKIIRGTTPQSINVFDKQYGQNPQPLEGLLYKEFKTYTDLPNEIVNCYIDTADEGSDYLCAIATVSYNGLVYIKDVLYTQEPMTVTEQLTVDFLNKNDVNNCRIESNNGGAAYARNVERMSRDGGNVRTTFVWFHQSKNKITRINTNSSTVQNIVCYPDNWAVRYSAFYDSMTTYMATGKNKHDDAQDCITGVVENININNAYW